MNGSHKSNAVDDLFGSDDFFASPKATASSSMHVEPPSAFTNSQNTGDDYFGERKPEAKRPGIDRAVLDRQLRESTVDDDIGGDFFDEGNWDKALEQAAKSLETTISGRLTAIGQAAHQRNVVQSQQAQQDLVGQQVQHPISVQGSGGSNVSNMKSLGSDDFHPSAKYRDSNDKKNVLRIAGVLILASLMIAIAISTTSAQNDNEHVGLRGSSTADDHMKDGVVHMREGSFDRSEEFASDKGVEEVEKKVEVDERQKASEQTSSTERQAFNATVDGATSDAMAEANSESGEMTSSGYDNGEPKQSAIGDADVDLGARSSDKQAQSFEDFDAGGDFPGSGPFAEKLQDGKDSLSQDFVMRTAVKGTADVLDEEAEVREILQLRTFAQALERVARRGEAAGAPSEVLEILQLPARNAEAYVRLALRGQPGKLPGLKRPLDPNFREKRERLTRSLEQGLQQYEAVMRADSVTRGQGHRPQQRTYKDSSDF